MKSRGCVPNFIHSRAAPIVAKTTWSPSRWACTTLRASTSGIRGIGTCSLHAAFSDQHGARPSRAAALGVMAAQFQKFFRRVDQPVFNSPGSQVGFGEGAGRIARAGDQRAAVTDNGEQQNSV